jgi:C_GCAxxG_C_C family probable redox protein
MALKNLDHEKLIRRVERLHTQHVEEKLSCSERTFLTVHNVVDTDVPSEVVALLTGFAGGVGGTHASVCGAVSGGVASLGLIYGRRHPAEEQRDRAYEVARDFFCQFKSRFGSEICGVLIGDTLHKNTYESEERRERCRAYTLHAVKSCVDLLAKYEKISAKA